MQTEQVSCPLCQLGNQIPALIILQAGNPCGLVKCRRCGLIFLNPRPTQTEHQDFHKESYFLAYYGETIDRFYQRQGDLYQGIYALNQARLKLVRPYIPSAKLLDVGAGQGMFITLAQQAGFQVVAVDVTDDNALYFRAKNYDYHVGYLEEMKFSDNEFEVVTMWHSLEHTLNPYTTLKETYRILKKGGYLFVAVPNFDSTISYLKLALKSPFFSPRSTEIHYFHFTPRTLKHILRKVGFRTILCRADLPAELKPGWRANLFSLINGLGKLGWGLMGNPYYANFLCVARKETDSV